MSIHWGGRGAGHISRLSTATTGVPALSLDFLSGALDSRISFSRASPATVINASGAIETSPVNTPRFDFDPVTLAQRGLLIEESRANLLTNSLISAVPLVTQNVTVTAVPHTLSFYGTGTITLTGASSATVTGTGAYPNRRTITFTPIAGVLICTVVGIVQFAQLEIGSFATSFIPTAATAVTRNGDLATMTGTNFTSWFNAAQGAFVSSFDVIGNISAATKRFVWNGSDAGNQRLALRALAPAVNFPIAAIGTGVGVASLNGTILTVDTITKLAVAYGSSLALSQNGATPATDASASSVLVSSFDIGCGIGANQLNGHMRSLTYYNKRPLNTQLQTLSQ